MPSTPNIIFVMCKTLKNILRNPEILTGWLCNISNKFINEFYCCVMYSGVEYVVCCYSECISHTRQAEKSA